MPAADPITPAPRRFAIRLPRPLCIGVAVVVVVVKHMQGLGRGIHRDAAVVTGD